jgi:hypothetical protein
MLNKIFPPKVRPDRIYGIGMGKTGTTTLINALDILGWGPGYHGPIPRKIYRAPSAADGAVAIRFRELAKRFPQARFILTVRDKESWLRSRENHKRRYKPDPRFAHVRQYFYATNTPQAEDEWPAYQRHVADVRQFFEGGDRLLELDICGGEGWEKLCPWLGVPVPENYSPLI